MKDGKTYYDLEAEAAAVRAEKEDVRGGFKVQNDRVRPYRYHSPESALRECRDIHQAAKDAMRMIERHEAEGGITLPFSSREEVVKLAVLWSERAEYLVPGMGQYARHWFEWKDTKKCVQTVIDHMRPLAFEEE